MEDIFPSVLGKRKRSWKSTEVNSAQEIIERHIELEVMLRLRTLEAAKAKIHWAEAMRQAIVDGLSQRKSVEDAYSRNALLTESAQALAAIERTQPLRRPHHSTSLSQDAKELSPKAAAMPIEADPTENRQCSDGCEEEPDIGFSENMPKPLFIQQESGAEPVTVLISCEVCGRSDFPTIHSLLSHARIGHAIYYRGHEELVGRCGRVVTGAEAQRVRRYGTEASSRIMLSMRSVIERGIGSAQGGGATLSTETLGLHPESAALAAFLGKSPKVHSIRVYEPEGDIDVDTVDHDLETQQLLAMRRRKATRTRYSKQTSFCNLAAANTDLTHITEHPETSGPPSQATVRDTASRFHLKRRLIITDSSHFLTEKDRLPPEQTHQWMITVSAPSYGEHITTFVSKLAVCRATEGQSLRMSAQAAQDHVHATDHPPFSVIGLASEPFLAQVRLDWVGGPSKPLIVCHWVRLDASRLSRTVVGEDQTLDVELDRNTPFRSEIRTAPLRFTTRAAHQPPREQNDRQLTPTSSAPPTSTAPLGYRFDNDTLLYVSPAMEFLLPKIPMTSQDLRARTVEGRTVSYVLPRSLNELLKLEHGRRKAYEWRHALSLKGALIKYAEADAVLSQRITDIRKLSTGVLYRWMDAHEVFPRPEPAVVEEFCVGTPLDGAFCRFCGLPLDSHPERLEEPSVLPEERIEDVVYDPPPRRPVLCPEADRLPPIPRPPIIDTQQLLDSVISCSRRRESTTAKTRSRADVSYRDVVQWTNPELVHYVQDLTSSFHLPAFDALSVQLSRSSFSPGQVGVCSAETDKLVGAYALLGQCLRIVVKQLVHHGVGAARLVAEQVKARRRTELIAQAFALGDPFPSLSENTTSSSSIQVLTPSHVLKGLSSASCVASHLRASVGRLAIGATGLAIPSPMGSPRVTRRSNRKGGATVKREDEVAQ